MKFLLTIFLIVSLTFSSFAMDAKMGRILAGGYATEILKNKGLETWQILAIGIVITSFISSDDEVRGDVFLGFGLNYQILGPQDGEKHSKRP